MKQVLREDYLKKLNAGRDRTDVVKVITGIRRCGKSTLMAQLIEQMISEGIDEKSIYYMNFESVLAQDIISFRDLNEDIAEKIDKKKRAYIFLDEIQRIEEWERTVNSLMVDYDADIYITGSNAHLLSSELSTYLSGRYVELNMLPLSFKEYLELNPASDGRSRMSRFSDYVWYGAMPMIDPDYDEGFIDDHLIGIYNTIMNKDIQSRLNVKDIDKLEQMSKFMLSNIGNITSSSSISKFTGMNHVTVRSYIKALEEAYIFYKAERYDIRGKKHLKTLEKYYVSDTGIRNAVLGNAKGDDMSRQIENVVYLELKRRGYAVSVGSYNDSEIDFTAVRRGRIEYYQVTQTMLSDETYERETKTFNQIRDNYSKTILSMDEFVRKLPDGIEHKNLLDWLLEY